MQLELLADLSQVIQAFVDKVCVRLLNVSRLVMDKFGVFKLFLDETDFACCFGHFKAICLNHFAVFRSHLLQLVKTETLEV